LKFVGDEEQYLAVATNLEQVSKVLFLISNKLQVKNLIIITH